MQREPVTKARRQLMTMLEQARKERGMDHEALAVESGIDPDTILKIISGDADASLDQWLSLCLALDVDINLNAAHETTNDLDELPDVMVCDEPINESELYLFHTRSPQSLWHCELIDDEDEEASPSEDGMLDFRTWDGYEEQWRVYPVALYDGATDDELQKASDRCSKYLLAYLNWEDEEMRRIQDGTF